MSPIGSTLGTSHRTLLFPIVAVAVVALFLVPGSSLASPSHVPSGEARTVLGAAGGGGASLPKVTVVKSSQYDWPELHQTPLLNGYATYTPLSSLRAGSLGVGWATNAYGSILDSPAVAYDPILGETLVYVGTETGNFLAVNLANGQIVWGVWFGAPIRSSPLVNNGSVWVVPYTTSEVLKLNATTGATECRTVLSSPSEATPTLAKLPNGVTTLFIGTSGNGPVSGPFTAIDAGNCSVEWKFTGFHQPAGSWNSASYVVNQSGVPVVILGTDNPDSSVYALDALTGHLLWRFQCYNPAGADWDVAAGATISPPGKNGFAQGVVYATNKAGRAYAIYLNNGTLVWETNFNALAGINEVARSTPALDGMSVVFGFAEGLFDLNAVNGSETWMYIDSTKSESIASPAIAGGHGHGIAVTGDVAGNFDVVAMVGGTQLYSYQTGGYITASPAISDGNILIASANGFLYDFVVGGGNAAVLPTTTISSPSQGSTVANPSGFLTVTGSASDPTAVAAVDVAIQSSGPAGSWWDAANGTWSPGPVDNLATLAAPGATSTTWSLAYPVPAAGGTYQVFANAVSSLGQSDLTGANVNFSVRYTTSGPHLEARPQFVPPGGTVNVTGGGFGRSVKVTISLLGATLAKVTSAANGSVPSTKVVIPATTLFGQTSLVATGGSPSKSSSAAITVANNWDQLGYGPGHAGFEPNDDVLNNVVFPGGNNWAKVAWHFAAPAPLNASPAVAKGVAFVGDTVGNLYAVDTHNGGMLWNFTLSTPAAIDGAVAVDPALGLVFIGTSKGAVDAVYQGNGTLAWSTALTGAVSAPVYASGELYVTTSTGAVDALSESSGTVVWTVTLGSPSTSAPALNASSQLLVVGESGGKVLGLNSSTGSTAWTYTTGGAVTATAVITSGTVYVGSKDGNLYALNELTGAKRWKATTHGAVQDTPSLDNQGLLYFGSDDGHLYVVHASTGAADFNFSFGSPVVGVSTAKGIAIYEDAAGTIGAEKTFLHGGGWHYATLAGLVTAPVILDGAFYVSAGDGFLYAFTPNGEPPV
jgi:outer membrane protein assembly factor BamB